MGLEWPVVVVFGLAIVAGSVVQGSAGFGVSLIGVPVLTLLDPTLMPGSMLVVGFILPLFTIVREGRYTDWPKVRLTLFGRLLGTFGGVLVVTSLPSRAIAIGIGVFILIVVLLSIRSVALPMNRRTLFGTGLLSGVTGTAASVSGPIVGLVMQRMPGAPLRATIAVFFSAGTFLSLTGLAIGGALPVRQVAMGALMLPFLAFGYALSGPLRRFLDDGWTRSAVLSVSGASAVVVLVKALFFDQ